MSKNAAAADVTAEVTSEVLAPGLDRINLLPSEIILDQDTDVRPWQSTNTDEEEKALIEALAKSIVKEGQLQDVVVREIETGTGVEYHAIAGRRRRAAIEFARTELKQSDLRVSCKVLRNVSSESAFRKALTENFRRLQMSPLDMAMNIQRMIEVNKWADDKNWSQKVAKELGVSRAWVTQKMKLLNELPADLQIKVHKGELSEDAAFTTLRVNQEQQAEVIRAAEQKAKEEAANTPKLTQAVEETKAVVETLQAVNIEEMDDDKVVEHQAALEKATEEHTKAVEAQQRGGTPPTVIQEKHVLAAAREQDALKKPEPLSRKELVELIIQFDGPAYGHENGDVRKWVRCFDECAKGTGKMTTFKKLFNQMTAGANEGTPTPKPEPEKLVTKADKAKKAVASKK